MRAHGRAFNLMKDKEDGMTRALYLVAMFTLAVLVGVHALEFMIWTFF